MFNALLHLDVSLTRSIFNAIPHNQFFDTIFIFLSLVGNSIFAWLIIMGIIIFLEERKDKRFIIYFLISFLATALLVNIVLKNIYDRPRPPVMASVHQSFTCPTDFSFPSGHAAAAFASAVILSAFDRKRRAAYYTIASLISLSRIYLGCHYFFDVTAGGTIGATISYIVLRFRHKLISR